MLPAHTLESPGRSWPRPSGTMRTRRKIPVVTRTLVADTWVEVARARAAAGDHGGADQARRNEKNLRGRTFR